MKAAVLRSHATPRPYAETRPLVIEEVTLGAPGPSEVLIRIRAAGLCHSDLSTINGDRNRPLPMVLGHEAAGSVEALGPGVSDLAVGDHVVLVFVPSCGHCACCTEGRPALCEPGAAANGAGTLLSGARRLSVPGGELHHHLGVSAFAEYAVVSRRSLVRVDRELPFEQAALFGCAVLTGVGAVVNTGGLRPGMKAAVIGLGGVGFSALLGALAAGASEVIAIDLMPDKLSFATELGATAVFDARDPDTLDAVKALSHGGVDMAFEMAGSPRALELAYRITRRGGTTVSAGLPNPSQLWPLQQVSLVAEERTVKGSYIGSCVPTRDLPRYIDLYRRGKLPVDRLMGERLSLADINSGFDRLAEGSALRQLVVFP